MKPFAPPIAVPVFVALAFLPLAAADPAADPLARGFADPPPEARIKAYWWWLNGNVTKAAITRDLEEMAAKGFGGALICDAGGAEQDGNAQVPHGPDFASPAWRDLYRHTLREADRLGLEMSLNIQSGWNLGGPMVKAEDAPKKIVWSEAKIQGPGKIEQRLPEPKFKAPVYRDIAVVAFPIKPSPSSPAIAIRAGTAQKDHPAALAADGSIETFWVSSGEEPGEGPTRERPEWLEVEFAEPAAVTSVRVRPRPRYGPREGEVQASDDGKAWQAVAALAAAGGEELRASLDGVRARRLRIVFTSAFDPNSPANPRNVQVAEVTVLGEGGKLLAGRPARRPIRIWEQKALHKALSFSAPVTAPLLEDEPAEPGEEDAPASAVLDITARVGPDGDLLWDAPPGEWEVLRFGSTLNDRCHVSTSSDGWGGYAIDPFDDGPFEEYWKAVVDPLIDEAGPLAGRALKYLHTDSWEVDGANWTRGFREEFKARRGYDLLPYLPVVAGRIIEGRDASNRFLHDFRKTMGDLAVDRHYRPYVDHAHARGLLIHPESGGPHAVPVDSLRCLGMNDAPMSEFWAWSWRHRVGDGNRFFVKQPASAAHTNGRRLVLAEGFTTIGPHWQETIWDNLKPAFDKAACEGLNRLVWHAFTCSPAEMGLPGQEYFAGTHFNPNSTWWSRSAPFLAYLDRCQFLLSRGLFAADACFYYGDHVPNFAQLKSSDPARVLPGYDYDVVTEAVVLGRLAARDGRLVLPDGMSYRVLVLPDRPAISLAVLRKVRDLVAGGATVVGRRPERATGLTGFPGCDDEVRRLAAEMWGPDAAATGERRLGAGRVIWGKTARDVLLADGVRPDFEFSGGDAETAVDSIHRRDGEAEIYFVANRSKRPEELACTFRVAGKRPELWDPLTGRTRTAAAWRPSDGRTEVPLSLAPCGSIFVVFRGAAAPGEAGAAASNGLRLAPVREVGGPWTVRFDPRWGGPPSAEFPRLESWTSRKEEGIRFYSGTATYETRFDVPEELAGGGAPVWLDLGDVRQLAEVRLNGEGLGVLWAAPFRVEVTGRLRAKENRLEVDVVNFWPNRVIGDASLPPEKRLTRTNIAKLGKDTPLVESGLLGPVTLQAAGQP